MREIVAGFATFSTLSYIIFVQPTILSGVGADFYTVLFATCISSAIATAILGTLTNFPFAIAPAMGHNVFFAILFCSTLNLSVSQALFINFISASVSLLLSLSGILWLIINQMPKSLKTGISCGIGLMIALIGAEWGGLITQGKGTLLALGDVKSIPFLATAVGLGVAGFLYAIGVRFAVLIGIIGSTMFLYYIGYVSLPEKFVSVPHIPNLVNISFHIPTDKLKDILYGLLTLLILDVFDTAGTLVGLFEVAKISPDKKQIQKAFISDSLGAVIGTVLGTTTLTTYVESAVGIQAGGRTKLTAFTISILFIASLFFIPVISLVGAGVNFEGKVFYPQIASAMIFVGFFILATIKELDFDDITESLPAFITILIITLSLSITDGIAFGFISYTLLKVLTGKFKDITPLTVILTIVFTAKFILT